MSTIIYNSPLCRAIVHCADIYRYKGVTFEWHRYLGPMLCRKDGEPSKRNVGRKTGQIIGEWQKLPKSKRERCRV